MTFTITLVAAQPFITGETVAAAAEFLAGNGYPAATLPETGKAKAAVFSLERKPGTEIMRDLRWQLHAYKTDAFVTPARTRPKRLLIADMDSTIVDSETLDELAAYAGLKDEIAAITARAMNGELDFKEALRARVAMLRGLPETTLGETLARIRLNPGAQMLVQKMRAQDATCVLVSGGFTCFTGPVAEMAGFTRHHGNTLVVENGALAGTVAVPILDKDSKLQLLHQYCADLRIEPADVLALGDGANDLPMLKAAGLGIGYRPKPVVEEQLENCILHGDLTAALYVQGIEL